MSVKEMALWREAVAQGCDKADEVMHEVTDILDNQVEKTAHPDPDVAVFLKYIEDISFRLIHTAKRARLVG